MAKLLRRKRQMAIKLEATEGTAETLAAADATMRVYDPTVSDEVPQFERDFARASLSPAVGIPGMRKRMFTFGVDLAGAEAAATEPSWGTALKACGMAVTVVDTIALSGGAGTFQNAETVNAAGGGSFIVVGRQLATATPLYMRNKTGTLTGTLTGATSGATATAGTVNSTVANVYLPTSTFGASTSATIGSYEDGYLKRAIGCRGTFTISARVGEPGRINFEMSGVEHASTDATLLASINYENSVPKSFLNVGYIQGAGGTTYSPIFSSVEINMGNEIGMRENANSVAGYLSALITSRNPTGTLDPEAELAATKNWYSDWQTPNVDYFEFTVGTVAGNRFKIGGPAFQITGISDGNRTGIALMSLEMAFRTPVAEDAGDNELFILSF